MPRRRSPGHVIRWGFLPSAPPGGSGSGVGGQEAQACGAPYPGASAGPGPGPRQSGQARPRPAALAVEDSARAVAEVHPPGYAPARARREGALLLRNRAPPARWAGAQCIPAAPGALLQ
eukprot:651651-Alexandrium_andersonii.AAC.1